MLLAAAGSMTRHHLLCSTPPGPPLRAVIVPCMWLPDIWTWIQPTPLDLRESGMATPFFMVSLESMPLKHQARNTATQVLPFSPTILSVSVCIFLPSIRDTRLHQLTGTKPLRRIYSPRVMPYSSGRLILVSYPDCGMQPHFTPRHMPFLPADTPV